MASRARQLARVISRPVKKLQKPRPLKTASASRLSTVDATNGNVLDCIMEIVETIARDLSNGNFDKNLQSNIVTLSAFLKNFGENLEVVYKDQLDRAFVIFRNGCRDENLDYTSRLHLLELIELRAMNWTTADGTTYYKHKYNHPDVDVLSLSSLDSSSLNSANAFQSSVTLTAPQQLILGPGELVKSSGKFPAPSPIPGKNYCKDEVVIRNSDSGKVMGIKGRRVHMIEELSETVISFQRVHPGAKERLVEIIGPTEDKINYAKQLMEETIKRNASPVRSVILDKDKQGSNSSLNSSGSEDGSRFGYLNDPLKRTTLLHSFSTSDANIGEYKYTVTIGEDTLRITGTNPNLVTKAKLVLDEYFLSEMYDQATDGLIEYGSNYFGSMYMSETEDDVFTKVGQTVPGTYLQSSSLINAESADLFVETENSREKENSIALQGSKLESIGDLLNKRVANLRVNASALNILDGHSKTPLTCYSCEKIILLANSPLSRKSPPNWDKIVKEFPSIVNKPPIEWFDSKAYMKERPQESDALTCIRSLRDPGSPDAE